jgi:hypothetical protein
MNQSLVDQSVVDQLIVDQSVVNNNLLKFILENKIYQPTEMEQLFIFIYENCIWGNDKSCYYSGSSGIGSYLLYNTEYINFLKQFIKDNNILIVNDLGCGTFLFGPAIYGDLEIIYNGYDIYKPLIDINNLNSTQYNTRFFLLDFYNKMENIPYSDLIILKDVFSSWNNECINNFLNYIITNKKCKYILIINCCYQTSDNLDVDLGYFRPLTSNMSPLKDFGATPIFNYRTKEVSLIKLI